VDDLLVLLAGLVMVAVFATTIAKTFRTDTARCCICNRQTKTKLAACQHCRHVCSKESCGLGSR
jgi:hypothetical protein